MSLRVVSTKLTEEEHAKLLEMCNRQGCTPSALIKQAIMEKIGKESETEVKSEGSGEKSLAELWEECLKENKFDSDAKKTVKYISQV